MTEHKSRPEMGKLVKGQRVMVRRSPNETIRLKSEDSYTRAVIEKIGRVYVEIKAENDRRLWRMKMDTQQENSQYSGSNASFSTMEQYAWDKERFEAVCVLASIGISVKHTSPWYGREIELMSLINGSGKDKS